MNITIKLAEDQDFTKLYKMKKAAFKPLFLKYNDVNSPYNHTLENMILRSRLENCDYYKILCDEAICGGTAVYKKNESENWLAIIYISPHFQNMKIAQTAIKQLFDIYTSVKKWGLDFPIDMIKNKRCYEKIGFKDTLKREIINDKLTLALYEKNI